MPVINDNKDKHSEIKEQVGELLNSMLDEVVKRNSKPRLQSILLRGIFIGLAASIVSAIITPTTNQKSAFKHT
jgi:uncharacterized membrane protein (DUF106 family)